MRQDISDPGSETYVIPEVYLNTLKRILINANTEKVLAVINIDSNGNQLGGLQLPKYDYLSRTLTDSVTETYIFKTGGSGGVTVATVVVVYTDSTLATLLTVTRT